MRNLVRLSPGAATFCSAMLRCHSGRATQCIGNTGEFDQQAITGCFDDAAPVCVFQAFTSAAVALANGAPKIVVVRTVKEALELRQAGIGEICLGEVYGRAPMALIS